MADEILGNADRSIMRLKVENHINSLNFIYKENVRYHGRLLKFRVKRENLEFRDASWCAKSENKDKVSCKSPGYWRQLTPNDFLNEQKAEAGKDNSDVCLAYFFISHTFRTGHERTIGLAYVERLCKGYGGANMGFVLFNEKTNNDDKNIESKFILAHEVGHNLGLYHDGPCSPREDGSEDTDEFCRIGAECEPPFQNLMNPLSVRSFNEKSIELSPCSKKMFEKLPKKSSDWECLADEELLYLSDDNTLLYVFSGVIVVLVIIVVILGVLLCHPRDLLAPYLPGHTRVGRTYTSARRYTATARKSVAVGAASAGRRMSVATAPLRRMTSVSRPAPNAPERPPVRRDLKPDTVQIQRSTDSQALSVTPTVLASSPGGAKRSVHQQKSGTPRNAPMPPTGFQTSSQKPTPHFQQSHKPSPGGGPQQGPRIIPFQGPQRGPVGGPHSTPERCPAGQGSPKSRPFIPLQPH